VPCTTPNPSPRRKALQKKMAAFLGVVFLTLLALTSSSTSPHRRTRRLHPRGSLPGPLRPWRPLPLQGRVGSYATSPRQGSRRLQGFSPWPYSGVLLPPDYPPPPDYHMLLRLQCSPRPFSGWGRTSELLWRPFCFLHCHLLLLVVVVSLCLLVDVVAEGCQRPPHDLSAHDTLERCL
jgi:hypothetical protein